MKNKNEYIVNDETQRELREWINELSVKSAKNLEIALSVLIPVSEVAVSNPFNLCSLPISSLGFSERGVSEEVARGLLEAIMWKTDRKEMSIEEDDQIALTSTGIKILKFIEQKVIERLDVGTKDEGGDDHAVVSGTPVEITRIDVLEDKNERKGVTIYININYENPETFLRKENWSEMYKLAREQYVPYKKAVFDYFNSNKKNPLYSRLGFRVTKILKQENGEIVPNIEIKLITQKAVTQRKPKSA